MQALVKQLARTGTVPPRPIFMPLFFAMAAKVGGMSPQQFFSNPTKIANGLRQLQGPLQCDALCCYADQTLIAEALGARLGWEADLPQVLAPPVTIAPTDIENRGRIPIMLEVLRRLRVVLRERVALAVALPGLLTTVEYIGVPTSGLDGPTLSDYLALAGGATLQAARLACEAGADLILLIEPRLPSQDSPTQFQWSAQVETLCRVARFYEALPVVLAIEAPNGNNGVGLTEAVLCLPTESLLKSSQGVGLPEVPYGIALPAMPIAPPLLDEIRRLRTANCVLVTTAGELPYEMEPKDLRAVIGSLRQII
ncbi:MAG: hypothetical protein FJ030_03765 [Chloroflexi bacterium]|nr:hypothetical protein [Chloroflexota bacterium]